jgi:hypothetical protein
MFEGDQERQNFQIKEKAQAKKAGPDRDGSGPADANGLFRVVIPEMAWPKLIRGFTWP